MTAIGQAEQPHIESLTYHSAHLNWSDSLSEYKCAFLNGTEKVYTCIEKLQPEEEMWQTVYIGYADSTVLENLRPCAEYVVRLRFHKNDTDFSEWSVPLKIITEKEPFYGEDLHKAIQHKKMAEIEAILKTGLVKVDVPDQFGMSGLMSASKSGNTEIQKLLISFNANINFKDDSGRTPLIQACIHGQLEAVKLLREHQADFHEFDRAGFSALHYAVDSGNCAMIEWMVKNGADINIADQVAGWTPLLRCASIQGNRQVGHTLLRCGADINATDNHGKTSLMISVINNHQPLLELLLEYRADLCAVNKIGRTAYGMAVSMEKRNMMKVLENTMDKQGIKYY